MEMFMLQIVAICGFVFILHFNIMLIKKLTKEIWTNTQSKPHHRRTMSV